MAAIFFKGFWAAKVSKKSPFPGPISRISAEMSPGGPCLPAGRWHHMTGSFFNSNSSGNFFENIY
ncbi:MAG: hypothetical protein U1D33_01855, partial [bacterium]|nr:hypothetical protein [bacterium]